MSPGRIASPSGMFSTRPITPTTLAFAFRAASACRRPTTQAAPPMSPFMSSMPGRGLDRDAARIEAHALADDDDRLGPFRARAVPPHGDEAAVARRSAAHAEQRVHAELRHRLLVERLDLDAELLQRFGSIGELDRKQHVRRLVDQIAGEFDALGDGEAVLRGGAGGGRMARADDEFGRFGVLVVRLLLARLVFVEPVAAQPKTEREIRGRGAVPGSGRRLERDFDPLRAGHLAENEAAERHEIERRVVLARRHADDESRDASRPAGARMSSAVRWAPRKLDALAAARISGSRSPTWAVTSAAGFMSAPTKTTSALPFGRGQRPKGDLDNTAHDKRASLVRIS